MEAEKLLIEKNTELHTALYASQRRQHRLKTALWGSGDYLWEWSAQSDMLELSEIDEPNSPTRKSTLPLINFFKTIHPSDLHTVMMEWNSHLFGQSDGVDAQFRIKRHGEWQWVRMRGRGINRDENKLAPTITGTARNVSEQHRDRRNLELLVNAFDNTSEGMCILSANRQIIDSNRAFNQLLGLRGQKDGIKVSGNRLSNFIHDDQINDIETALDSAEENHEWQGELEIVSSCADTPPSPTWVSITAMHDGDTLSYFVLSAIDISDRKQAEKALQNLANYDSLTQLSNRGFFESRLDDAIAHAKRSNETMALLFVDLDRFKQINDTMGHKTGDDLLVALAARLNDSIRISDMAGRWGGDEFVVLLTSLTTPRDAYRVAEKIREAVLEPMMLQGVNLTVSTSIGVALFPQDANNKEELLERADKAMYEAKSNGRNKVGCYERGMSSTTNEKLMLELSLRDAVANNEFELYYQPKVCLKENKVKSVEALIRWNSPQHGFVSPADFIPLAEESGLILEIGSWVLDTACRQLKKWQGTQFEDLHIAVNVSANQLRQQTLIDEITQMLTSNQIDAHKLEIELTESCLLTDVDKMKALFEQMRLIGLSIAIDDFGTGYSSLAYLKDLPINTLKVDRAFVSQIGVDQKGEAIVRTIIMLAKNLNLNVVAEGVETAEQDSFLKDLDCDTGQGYLYYKPAPLELLEQTL